MRFYFNVDENTCMDEDSLISYLNDLYGDSKEDIKEELHSCREYFGWYECEVSDTIKEKFDKGRE